MKLEAEVMRGVFMDSGRNRVVAFMYVLS